MMLLNSQVEQFGGFTHGQSVFGRTPKMPIGAVGNPHFEDYTNPVGEPTAETHHLLGAIQQIRQASLTAYFSGILDLALRKRIRESENREFLLGQALLS